MKLNWSIVLLLMCNIEAGGGSKGQRKRGRHRRSHYTTTTTPMTPPMTYDLNPESSTKEEHISPVPRHHDSVVPSKYFTAPQNINPHPYKYKINNPHTCYEQKQVFLLMAVLSSPGNVDRRMAVRDTWGASYNLPDYAMPVIFLLGDTYDLTAQLDIQSENNIYNDMVQEDFMDTAANISIKTVMAYKWARTFCSKADFVLVTTDDVIIDTYKLAPYLMTQKHTIHRTFSLCHLVRCCKPAKPVTLETDTNTQDYTMPQTVKPYEGQEYPPYCSTNAYVLPTSVINQLYIMSLDTPIFSPHYAYIGVLAEKLGLLYQDTQHSFAGIRGKNSSVGALFNSSLYLDSPLIVGILSHQYPQAVSRTLRQLWLSVLNHHRNRPKLDVKRYMKIPTESDHHIYFVALVALCIDIVVLGTIGYLILCRRRLPKTNGHISHR